MKRRGGYKLKLVEIIIENFRGIESLKLPFDDLTVIIGENSTGKTTVLEAIRIALTHRFGNQGCPFSGYDFHLANANATPQEAAPIKIVLHFAETEPNEWADTIYQKMDKVFQPDDSGVSHIYYQVKCDFNNTTSTYDTEYNFLNLNGDVLGNTGYTPRTNLFKLVPLFFLSAIRDATQEFSQRGQFWGSFLKAALLNEAQREKIEEMLSQINTEILEANEGLKEVTQKISDAKKLVPLDPDNPVVLEALPTRVFDMVGKVQVNLKTALGAKLPLHRHGEGTKNLAVLMLFQAFAAVNLIEEYSQDANPILAFEEPEAHLHPSAVRSLGKLLEGMEGQIIISSHSGDLVSRIPATSIRRLYKIQGETKIGRLTTNDLTEDEKRKLDYHIMAAKGSYLFAKCWLLVEGQSEYWVFLKVTEILGHEMDEKNFAIVDVSQSGGPRPFIKMANALGIEWFVVADGDRAGDGYINAAKHFLEPSELEAQRMHQFRCKDLEHFFWDSGFEDVYKKAIDPQELLDIEATHTVDPALLIEKVIKSAVNKRSKPGLAMDLALELEKRGPADVPQEIKDIIKRVTQLIGG